MNGTDSSRKNASTDSALKFQFKENYVANFWLYVRTDYPELSYKALKVIIPIPTNYICEKVFSALMNLKNKYRNRLRNAEADLRIQLSEIKPNIEKLVAEMQHQTSDKNYIFNFCIFFVCEWNKMLRNLCIG
jgi:hypothetical protein